MKNYFLLFLAFIVVVIMFAMVISVSYDYNRYTEAANNFIINPKTLYTAESPEYYYMPWAMAILVPLSTLPIQVSQSLFMAVTLFITAFVIYLQFPARSALILSLANIFYFSNLGSAQWDMITVLAIFMAYKAAEDGEKRQLAIWSLLAICKPTHAIIPLTFIFLKYRKEFLHIKTITWTAVPIMFFTLLVGVDWPMRYIEFARLYPPPEYRNISLLPQPYALPFILLSIILAIFILLRRKKNVKLSALLVASLLLSPYLQLYHLASCTPALANIKSRLIAVPISISLIVWYLAVTQNAIVLATVPSIICTAYCLSILCILAIEKD